MNAEKVHKIHLDEIVPNPFQPRKNFDQAALEDLAASIKNEGVFQPIIIRQPKRTVKQYEIIAGERRFRASKMAGLDTIPAIVRDLSNEQMMQVAVIENLQREDLSPIEEAQAYHTLMENLNITQSELAKRLGKSRPFIANYLRLLTLPLSVKDLVEQGALSMGQARTLLGLKAKDQITTLAKQVIEEGLTVRQLEELVSELNGVEPRAKEVKPKAKAKAEGNKFIKAAEGQLEEKFGTKVLLKSKTNGKGKIEINYLSDDDLSRILNVLNISLD